MAQEITSAEVTDCPPRSERRVLALRVEELTSENYLSGGCASAHEIPNGVAVSAAKYPTNFRKEPGQDFRSPGEDDLIAPGALVTIVQLSVVSGPAVEGRAIAEEPIGGIPDAWRVRFVNESASCVRFAHPEYQSDPERMIAILRDLWVAGVAPETLNDFFPEDLRASPPATE